MKARTDQPISPEQALCKAYRNIFLRGQSARGINKEKAAPNVAQKLGLTLLAYGVMGITALLFIGKPIFLMSGYVHAMTFFLVGMFVVGAAGEALFNREEADILLHRPVTPQTLLKAKLRVMVELSLYLAFAFNLVPLLAGVFIAERGMLFLIAHAITTVMLALFCAGAVVLSYQLCLKWLGRERLDGLMTAGQVFMVIAMTTGSQVLPRMMMRPNISFTLDAKTWWVGLIPPTWFAGFDDAISGKSATSSWILAAIAVVATFGVLALAIGKLSNTYGEGMMAITEAVSDKPSRRRGMGLMQRVTAAAPFKWVFRNPIERTSFLLVAAYLGRDRDFKLRFYPGVAPMAVMPIFMLFGVQSDHLDKAFVQGIMAFVSAYFSLIPMTGSYIVGQSQQWKASEIFQIAPTAGPGVFSNGARLALLWLATYPVVAAYGVTVGLISGFSSILPMLPCIVILPAISMIGYVNGAGVPFSAPPAQAEMGVGCVVRILVLSAAGIVSTLGVVSLNLGLFWPYLAFVLVLSGLTFWLLDKPLRRRYWSSAE